MLDTCRVNDKFYLVWLSVYIFFLFISSIYSGKYIFGVFFVLITFFVHVGLYILEVVMGDRLLLIFINGRYEIYYRNGLVKSGALFQEDIEIRFDNGGRGEYFYVVKFLPFEKDIKYSFFMRGSSLCCIDKEYLPELCLALENILDHVNVNYDHNKWSIIE